VVCGRFMSRCTDAINNAAHRTYGGMWVVCGVVWSGMCCGVGCGVVCGVGWCGVVGGRFMSLCTDAINKAARRTYGVLGVWCGVVWCGVW